MKRGLTSTAGRLSDGLHLVSGLGRLLRPVHGVASVTGRAGFPGRCPVALDELLRAADRTGRFHHLSLSRLRDGRYQASFKATDGEGYRVVIVEDVCDAVEGALAPAYGHPWAEVLGEPVDGNTDRSDALDDLLVPAAPPDDNSDLL